MNLLVHDIEQEPSKENEAVWFHAQTPEDHEINKNIFRQTI